VNDCDFRHRLPHVTSNRGGGSSKICRDTAELRAVPSWNSAGGRFDAADDAGLNFKSKAPRGCMTSGGTRIAISSFFDEARARRAHLETIHRLSYTFGNELMGDLSGARSISAAN